MREGLCGKACENRHMREGFSGDLDERADVHYEHVEENSLSVCMPEGSIEQTCADEIPSATGFFNEKGRCREVQRRYEEAEETYEPPHDLFQARPHVSQPPPHIAEYVQPPPQIRSAAPPLTLVGPPSTSASPPKPGEEGSVQFQPQFEDSQQVHPSHSDVCSFATL